MNNDKHGWPLCKRNAPHNLLYCKHVDDMTFLCYCKHVQLPKTDGFGGASPRAFAKNHSQTFPCCKHADNMTLPFHCKHGRGEGGLGAQPPPSCTQKRSAQPSLTANMLMTCRFLFNASINGFKKPGELGEAKPPPFETKIRTTFPYCKPGDDMMFLLKAWIASFPKNARGPQDQRTKRPTPHQHGSTLERFRCCKLQRLLVFKPLERCKIRLLVLHLFKCCQITAFAGLGTFQMLSITAAAGL